MVAYGQPVSIVYNRMSWVNAGTTVMVSLQLSFFNTVQLAVAVCLDHCMYILMLLEYFWGRDLAGCIRPESMT